NTLERLRDLGNTVIVVEHDEEAIREADQVVDLGPGAGDHGGHLVAQGTAADIAANTESLTGQYLAGTRVLAVPEQRVFFANERRIDILGAHGNNLQHIDVALSMGQLTCVTGVSG